MLETFGSAELTFSAAVIVATGLLPEEIQLWDAAARFRCTLFACSMTGAKVATAGSGRLAGEPTEVGTAVSLRFGFRPVGSGKTSIFVVPSRVAEMSDLAGDQGGRIMSLQFRKRPPGDLIETVGTVLRANAMAASKRSDERIAVDDRVAVALGFGRNAQLLVDNSAHRALLRDLSFSGALTVTAGVPTSSLGSPAALRLSVEGDRALVTIAGRVVRAEHVEAHDNLVAVAIQFETTAVPELYRLRLSRYLAKPRA